MMTRQEQFECITADRLEPQWAEGEGGFDVVDEPAPGANLISSHCYDPTVQVPWSHSLTKNWTVAGMFCGRRRQDGEM
jgi:hypothetical protein